MNLASGVTDTPEQMRFDELGYSINPFDEVVPGLCQASSYLDPPDLFVEGFDAIFDLGGWPRGDSVPGLPYVFHQIDDVPWIDDPSAIDAMGEQVASRVRVGERVVVNCAAGLNRSGLLVGRALIALGYAPVEAIELVRQARGIHALSNHRFAAWLLLECPPRGLRARTLAYRPNLLIRAPRSKNHLGPPPA